MHFHKCLLVPLLVRTAFAFGVPVFRRQQPPQASGTALNIGQNYEDEWQAFAGAVRTPAGISVYGDIYSGALNPDSQNLLRNYATAHGGNVEIGFSWKDAMTNNGYTQYQGALLNHDIASGKYDTQLHSFGTYLSQYTNITYLLRIEYEVSGNLFANTAPSTFDPSTFDIAAYPAAYRHVRTLISSLIPTGNIKYVYHAVRGQAPLLYPGDDVVDAIAFSIFNNDVCLPAGPTVNDCGGGGATIDPNLQDDINWATTNATKPKLIAESAVQPPSSESDEGFIEYLTRVKAVVQGPEGGWLGWTYINSDWTVHGWDPSTWGDSRVDSRPGVLQWFMQNIVDGGGFTFG